MKEFYIINVGTSIITNCQRSLFKDEEVKNKQLSDNEFWASKLNQPEFLNKIYNFVKENLKENSAELNSFSKKTEGTVNKIEVYFVSTKTPVNEICVKTLEKFMKESGFIIYTSKEFSVYFKEPRLGENKVKSFIDKIFEILGRFIQVAERKSKEKYRVYFNPTKVLSLML